MQSQDIDTVKAVYDSINKHSDVEALRITNPALEVETSLVAFLKHRLDKLRDDVDFEDNIKNAIFSRLSEATFPQLISLLEILQKNSNIGVEKVLAPFIASSGEKTILDTTKETNRTSQIADKIFEETNDESVLQSLEVLSQLVNIVNRKEEENSKNQLSS